VSAKTQLFITFVKSEN